MIERSPTGVAAFVGRTLKGPVDRPVSVGSFSEFEQIFGGLWQPAPLSYAVEQYFDNGGRRAIVVRVANGAKAPTLALPAGRAALHLEGINPGSREYLRAAVDYDGTGGDPERFNLVLQRLRLPGAERVEDQETLRDVSIDPGSPRFVGNLLLGSHLVRMHGGAPAVRPDNTTHGTVGGAVRYVSSGPDGDDGAPLSDYDVIGSVTDGTGLWALQQQEGFDVLCIPPLARDRDVGLATLHVASRFCRERQAMLVVDPPVNWSSPEQALIGLHAWPFRSSNAVMFYPRVAAFDRLRNRVETFGSAAAAAGMLAREDRVLPVWAPAQGEEAILRPGLKPAVCVEDPQRKRLSLAGINTLLGARSGGRARLVPCTLAGEAGGPAEWRHLAARRLALFVVSSIVRGTRWLLAAPNEPIAWTQAQSQVERFLEGLYREGAFAGSRPEDSYFAICDERVNRRETVADGKLRLLFGIATARPAQFRAWLLTCRAGTSEVHPVAVNRDALGTERDDPEIEAGLWRANGDEWP